MKERHRPIANRLLAELLYGEGTHITEDGQGSITLQLTGLARVIHNRPVRSVEALEWIQARGIITDMEHGYRTVTLRLKRSPRYYFVGGDDN